MKKPTKESIRIAGYISEFLNNYVLSQKTDSMNTLKSYRDTLALYLTYLEEEKKGSMWQPQCRCVPPYSHRRVACLAAKIEKKQPG